MGKAVGLITEYNPFHNGHQYHLQQAKQLAQADTVIAVMSGNFVQRGEPALYDKWQRAAAAVENGVDLVLELPVAFAIQSGPFFAQGAVELLVAAGVSEIVFGAEHADWDFMALAKAIQQAPNEQQIFQQYNQTYASSYNQMLKERFKIEITDPNDWLGLSYALALLALGQSDQVQLHAIQRQGSAYHELELQPQQFASATALRQALRSDKLNPEQLALYVPKGTQRLCFEQSPLDWNPVQQWSLLKYIVMTRDITELAQIYQLNDGLAQRLQQTVQAYWQFEAVDWDDFMQGFKSKRYTYSRLQRNILYVLLNITQGEMEFAMRHLYFRPLAFNTQGQAWLKNLRKQAALPLIGRVNQENSKTILKLDVRAGRLYEYFQPNHQVINKDVHQHPFILKGASHEMEFK
ncbi:nucleotidyltransferase [Weissella kandleri]|uniref:nucleotidyltransferase n=1 Tax=Weissella kandleri TaxID=1616 RepID=UPI00387E423C